MHTQQNVKGFFFTTVDDLQDVFKDLITHFDVNKIVNRLKKKKKIDCS